jgi:hypothetical protein
VTGSGGVEVKIKPLGRGEADFAATASASCRERSSDRCRAVPQVPVVEVNPEAAAAVVAGAALARLDTSDLFERDE